MAPVTIQFWSANANRYYEYSGYSGMRKLWLDAINVSHPDMVEIITWNDFVEGTYVSPIDDPNKYQFANFLFVPGVTPFHAGLLPYPLRRDGLPKVLHRVVQDGHRAARPAGCDLLGLSHAVESNHGEHKYASDWHGVRPTGGRCVYLGVPEGPSAAEGQRRQRSADAQSA
jgi:hypothetical protein